MVGDNGCWKLYLSNKDNAKILYFHNTDINENNKSEHGSVTLNRSVFYLLSVTYIPRLSKKPPNATLTIIHRTQRERIGTAAFFIVAL